jgi:site-specific DNA-methyltransferase (adenine-specific)
VNNLTILKMIKIGQAELHNIDCMAYMATLPDKAFDLAIVDPPYGIDVTKMNMGSRQTIRPDKTKTWDLAVPNKEYFDELKRVSKNQIIWGGNYFALPPTRCWLIWDKGESMYGRDFAEAEMAWTSFDKVVRLNKLNPNQLDRIHPTQKPVKLYEWLLTNYAEKGQKILDTHLGSGSIAVACNNLGFDLVGCELDQDYYKSACDRVNQATAQTRMF